MARDFSGANTNYLSVAGTPFSTTTYSCGGWAYLDANDYGAEPNGNPMMITHAYSGGALPVALGIGETGGMGTNTRWACGRYDGGWATISDTIAAPLSAWTHILMTMGSGTCRLYRNGAEVNNGSITVVNGTTNSLLIGRRWDAPGTNNALNGRLAEVGFWSAVLNADEAAALGKGVSPSMVRRTSLIGYWPLWGVAFPEIDLAGNARTLSQNGTVSASATGPPTGRQAPMMGAA